MRSSSSTGIWDNKESVVFCRQSINATADLRSLSKQYSNARSNRFVTMRFFTVEVLAVVAAVLLCLVEDAFAFKTALGRGLCRINKDGESTKDLFDGIAKVAGNDCLQCSCVSGVLSCSDDACEEEKYPKKCPPDFKRCGNMYYRRLPEQDCELPECPEPEVLKQNTDENDGVCPTDTHLCQETGELVHRQARLGCKFECVDDSTPQPIDTEDLTEEEKKELEKAQKQEAEEEAKAKAEEKTGGVPEDGKKEQDDPEELVKVPKSEDSIEPKVMCPGDIKRCADGTQVGRVGEDCHFPACEWELPEISEFWKSVIKANATEREKLRDKIVENLPGGLGSYRFIQRACKFGDKVVRHGWRGRAQDSDALCNTCECKDGTMECTRYVCNKPFVGARSCKAPDGSEVAHGWVGKGSGEEWCKSTCKCNDGRYYCTRGVCPDKSTVENPDEVGAQCQNGDELLPDGYKGPGSEGDWCKTCSCNNGKLSCDKEGEDCESQDEEAPEEDLKVECELTSGKKVPFGWQGKDDSHNYCNTCTCEENANLNCDDKACEQEEPEDEEEPPAEVEIDPEEDTEEEEPAEVEQPVEEVQDETEGEDEEEAPELPGDVSEEEKEEPADTEGDEESEAEGPPAVEEIIPPFADEEELSPRPTLNDLILELELQEYFDLNLPEDVDRSQAPARVPGKSGAKCTLSNGQEAPHGEVFNLDDEDNWCNTCICNDGRLYCDMYECPEMLEKNEQDKTADIIGGYLKAGYVGDQPEEDQYLRNEEGSPAPKSTEPSGEKWYSSTAFFGGVGGLAGVLFIVGAVIVIRRSRVSTGSATVVESPVARVEKASYSSRPMSHDITTGSKTRKGFAPTRT